MQVKVMDQLFGQVNVVFGKFFSKGKGKGIVQGRNKGNKFGKLFGGFQGIKVRSCFCCNYIDYMVCDLNCFVCSKKCNVCGEIGYFVVCCKIKECKFFRKDDEGRNNI